MDKLTTRELIHIGKNRGLYDEELNKEWYKRFEMNFPYDYIDDVGILNRLTKGFVGEGQCDNLIMRQAIEIKERGDN